MRKIILLVASVALLVGVSVAGAGAAGAASGTTASGASASGDNATAARRRGRRGRRGPRGFRGPAGGAGATGGAGPAGPAGPPATGATTSGGSFDLRSNFGAPTGTKYNDVGLRIDTQCQAIPNVNNPLLRFIAASDNNSVRAYYSFVTPVNLSGQQTLDTAADGTEANYSDIDFDQGTNDSASVVTDDARSAVGFVNFANPPQNIRVVEFKATHFGGQPQGDCVITGIVLTAVGAA